MAKDLAKWAKEKGVKYFMISYTDLFGAQRAKLVPTQAINDMAVEGAGFAGFATWLDLTPAHPDLMAVPDADSVIQLPWKKEVAWVAARATMEDKLVDQAPRNVLEKLIAEAAKDGLRVKTGVEPEFFILNAEGLAVSDAYDTAEKPCYDQQAIMRRYDVISEVSDYMLEMGWEPYQSDHEDAPGRRHAEGRVQRAGEVTDEVDAREPAAAGGIERVLAQHQRQHRRIQEASDTHRQRQRDDAGEQQPAFVGRARGGILQLGGAHRGALADGGECPRSLVGIFYRIK